MTRPLEGLGSERLARTVGTQSVVGNEPADLVEDFLKVAALAGCPIPPSSISYEEGANAHRATLPKGKMACYVFVGPDRCLKVGKVGPNSGPRFSYQHYDAASSNSNLAKSLLSSRPPHRPFSDADPIDETSVGDWIRSNTRRANFYLDAALPPFALSLLEAFLQCRLRPVFEGRL